MAKNNQNQSTVTAGSGYRSIKSTEIYTPDTAPINYQSPVTEDSKAQASSTHIVLEQDKPKKEITIRESLLDTISQVYVSGQYAIKGHHNMRVREILNLIIRNTGLYRVVVTSSTIRNTIINIIDNGNRDILGEEISKYNRDRIIMKFKHDNALS
jgi:hypothetical protein